MTEKNSLLSRFFDNSGTFRDGKQIGITLVCIMQYVCGLMNKNQNTNIPTEAACRKIILQASIQALPFYKYGLGFKTTLIYIEIMLLISKIKVMMVMFLVFLLLRAARLFKVCNPLSRLATYRLTYDQTRD